MTVSLTLAIMEGMEDTIFNSLKNVSFPAKFKDIPNNSNHQLKSYLSRQKIEYLNGIEDQVLIVNNDFFRSTA